MLLEMFRKYFGAIVLFCLPLMVAAQSPQKLIDRGEYDQAMDVAIERLEKGRGDATGNYVSLKLAYETANRQDEQKLISIKSSGAPDIWYDVFLTYQPMQRRYEKLENIRERLESDRVNITPVDYSADLEAARTNAITYLYAHAQSLLKSGSPEDGLQAYTELLKVSRLQRDYKDTEKLMRKAMGTGFGKAFLEMKNRSDMPLSPDYMERMTEFELKPQERIFLDYARREVPGEVYPLIIRIDIDEVEISPGTVSEKEYTTSLKDPESVDEEYQDETKKEADMKHPDYNKCKVTEVFQVKTAMMRGKVKYIDGNTGALLYVVPVKALSRFENRTATASGDMYACPPEVMPLLDAPKKKFPSNADMLVEVGKEFSTLVRNVIWDETFIK